MSIDWKNVGLTALDVVTGIGGAVAGAYGGPAASQGVVMAGGAIKGLVNQATESDEKPSRKEQHDRQDFQARAKAPAQLPAASDAAPPTRAKLSDSDEAVARAELAKLGYANSTIDAILAGPPSGAVASNDAKPATSAAPVATSAAPAATSAAPPPVEGNITKGVDWERLASVAGNAIKGYMGNNTGGFDGTTLGAIPATGTPTAAAKGTRTS